MQDGVKTRATTHMERPPSDPPSTEDVNVARFSHLVVAEGTYVTELDNDRWGSDDYGHGRGRAQMNVEWDSVYNLW